MHDSITIADVGSMVNVSGRRIATPFGPPSPGRTPTKIPSTSPTIISASVFQVSRTPNPCSNNVSASIAALESEGSFERALRHDHVECKVEGDEHHEREQEGRRNRLPQSNAPDEIHEAGNEQKAREINPEPLREQTEQDRRHEYLQHASQLITRDERPVCLCAGKNSAGEPVDRGGGKDDGQIEREIRGL